MHRRDFLKLSAGVAGAMAFLPNGAMSMTPDEANPAVGRLVFGMNQKWRFSPQRIENAVERNFDDSGFEQVTLPHVRGMTAGKSFLTYRRTFRLPPNARGHHVLVELNSFVPGCSVVWINGQCVATRNKYFSCRCDSPVSFDLTPHVDWPGENVLVVRVGAGPFTSLVDYNHTFNFRDVELRLMPPTYLEVRNVRLVRVANDAWAVNTWCLAAGRDLQTSRLMLETELHTLNRVVATARRTFGPTDTVAGLVPHVLMPANFRAGEMANLSAYREPYFVTARIIRRDGILDKDQWPASLPKRPGETPGPIDRIEYA